MEEGRSEVGQMTLDSLVEVKKESGPDKKIPHRFLTIRSGEIFFTGRKGSDTSHFAGKTVGETVIRIRGKRINFQRSDSGDRSVYAEIVRSDDPEQIGKFGWFARESLSDRGKKSKSA